MVLLNRSLIMDYLVLPGDSCYTPSQARGLVGSINECLARASKATDASVRVTDLRGSWLYYVHLASMSDNESVQVSEGTACVRGMSNLS